MCIGFLYFRGFLLLSGMLMSDQRWSSCTLSDGKHNNSTMIPGGIPPHTWYRVCPFWTVRCDSCHDELYGIWTWKVFSFAALLLLRLANVWCGEMRKHARPAGLSALLAATSARLSTVNSSVIRSYTAGVGLIATSLLFVIGSSNRNLQGESSNEKRTLHIRHTIHHISMTYARVHDTTCRSTGCRVLVPIYNTR